MAIEHESIPEAGLHEPKGVSTSLIEKVYHADGAGSGVWKYPELKGQGVSSILDLPFSSGGDVIWRQGATKAVSLITATSVVTQQPSAVDTPLQVEFGAAQAITGIDLSVTGTITCLVAGTYTFAATFRFERSTAVGVAHIVLRALLGGVQLGPSFSVGMNDTADAQQVSFTNSLDLSVNDTLAFEIVRDSSGINDGGLGAFNPVLAGWSDVASADLRVGEVVVV